LNQQFDDIEDFLIDESFRSWVKNPTPELDDLWALWLLRNPEKEVLRDRAKELLLTMKFEEFEVSDDTKKRILNQIRFETSDWNQAPTGSNFFYYWKRIAAILLISVMLGALIYQYTKPITETTEVAQLKYLSKENPFGVRSQHILSDGSKVHLNAGSKIEYLKVFGESKRYVKLSGEAYFEVVKDQSRPFIVEANDVEVTVLGTKFNVRANESEYAVALLEGSVKVSMENASQLIKPGEEVRLSELDEFVVSEFDEKQVFGWTKGKLVFQDASFEEVKDQLRKWYGVEVIVTRKPSGNDWSYTGTFTNESLESVLLNMSVVRPFDFKVKGDSVRITF
jgi:transmembrane sensor